MRSGRIWASTLVLGAVLSTSSCWPFRRARRPAPVPAPQPSQSQTPPAETQVPAQLPAPPQLPAKTSQTPPPAQLPKEQAPPGPPPVPQKRPSPAGPPVEAPAPASPAPAAPAPQLRQILTSQQQQELNREINDRLSRARYVVSELQKRRLNSSQKTSLNQVQTFINQAEAARKQDLVRANNMAERADVLARDLWNSLR